MVDLDDLIEIYAYLKKRVENNNYKNRNQFNLEKIKKDILTGKLAEFACYYHLIEKGYILNKPDLTIFESNKKSFDADLYVECKDIKLHVKAYNTKLKSCLFEKNDPLVIKPEPNDYIVLMQRKDFLNFDVYKWVKASECKYDKPVKDSLKSKVALYI